MSDHDARPPRSVEDIAHDLANAAMLVEGAAGRLRRGTAVDAAHLGTVADRLYELIEELSERDS